MGYEKFTWVIKNFSSLQSKYINSDKFVIGGCKWFLKGYQNANYLSLFLMVATSKTLPCGWRRYTRFRLTVVNQLSDELSQQRETETWFDQNVVLSGNRHMISLTKLNAKKGGFLVNNEVKIVVEVDVLQVIGKLDVSEGSQEVTQPLKRIRLNDDGVSVKQSIDVNGFQVLPSQVESVKRIFERHPNMALEFRAKNQHVRTSCMNVLLSLIDTLCQSLQDISIDDLGQAEKALRYLKDSDFKVDWLERKLEEVKEKKMEEQIGKSRMQELEEELKIFKQKCSDIEAQLEKEKQKCSDIEALLEKEKAKSLAAARAPPLTLDDVV
ncbi:TRAF-like family protein [Arabidopsis thaliana]|uniref:MATH domain and coiled-coil domain-containing protein At3g44790 n=1 Tax=Arabidopsis thaliana TaxID=3702 RepID=MCC13_ARATH|nr:TRAF-like family protein [Arabidopsis thaliana]F4J4A0.1 RecName: Full=MATH domain and coiled-coil domain-containing protein At3g44790; AltName: Full=RTM3-like protein At3g44790 [Arabidopsis thaliana]AEE77954.1 TRAF-like family protein [Arabidopsis thaliana]|eukprot:NP_190065.1 TRAF-like family protein [Arabidopsis thaliana]